MPSSLLTTKAPSSAPIVMPPNHRVASSVTVFDWSGGFGVGNCRSSSPPASRSGRKSPDGCAIAESNRDRPPAVHTISLLPSLPLISTLSSFLFVRFGTAL
ncbi:uncharacterized protein DS421_4g116410 [Arachis hypogaea]|nr:uncharacterized protein DS421_4g116410 [Arachis hypogaea]